MSKKISCTVTVGAGSERHNHDLKFREALDHTHTADCPEAIIELVPYRSYKDQINDLMKPYIDKYNQEQQRRYEEAWERYNAGKIKTKPRKRDYKTMDYDYYSEHKDDVHQNPRSGKVEKVPMWREVIFGLGDQDDRQNGFITKEEAVSVMRKVVERWSELFPCFKLLGATIHLDEEGFYHCHIDYKPLYEKDEPGRGLAVGIGQDASLKRMGYTPEQSIINGRDKAPILFNAFRNRLYYEVEEELNKHGLRLLYGVSEVKEPGKDSSKKQKLEDWKATQDGVHELQQMKNNMLDVVESDHVSPDSYKAALRAFDDIEKKLDEIESQPRSRLNKNLLTVPFTLLSQLRSFIENVYKIVVTNLLHQIDVLNSHLDHYEKENAELRRKLYGLDSKVKSAEKRHQNQAAAGLQVIEKEQEK